MAVQDRPTLKQGKGRRKTAAAVEPTETELHMAGLLYIAYLLANNEASLSDWSCRRS